MDTIAEKRKATHNINRHKSMWDKQRNDNMKWKCIMWACVAFFSACTQMKRFISKHTRSFCQAIYWVHWSEVRYAPEWMHSNAGSSACFFNIHDCHYPLCRCISISNQHSFPFNLPFAKLLQTFYEIRFIDNKNEYNLFNVFDYSTLFVPCLPISFVTHFADTLCVVAQRKTSCTYFCAKHSFRLTKRKKKKKKFTQRFVETKRIINETYTMSLYTCSTVLPCIECDEEKKNIVF